MTPAALGLAAFLCLGASCVFALILGPWLGKRDRERQR